MRTSRSGGGWQALRYAVRLALKIGPLKFVRAMRTKNACKTCALGMGGQLGGMRNEAGHFPEVCKKSMQAMAADMRGKIDRKLFETYSIAQLQGLSPRELELFGRLTEPLVAGPGDTHYRIASWDEALDLVAESLKRSEPERTFFYASGRSSNEAGFILNLFARAFGTNHLSNCSYYCHQASGVGLKDAIGSSTATIELDDLDKCDLFFLIGGNPASNHPRLMTSLMKMRARGGKIVVINPAKELGLVNFKVPSNIKSMLFGSEIASRYLQPTIGGDIAVLAGIAKCVLEQNGVDQAYIGSATDGFAAVRDYVDSLSWADIESASGIRRPEIEAAAADYIGSKRTVFAWTMGITHHLCGVENVHWIINLALLRGMVGREGAGLLPIRGHSNVQGMGSVGVTPALSKAAIEGLGQLGLKPPEFEGHDTLAAMEACQRGELDFGLCLGGNLYGANPDANYVSDALKRLKTLAYLSTSLNTGHVHGLGQTTVVLPVLVRDEESQATTQESMFSYVRLSEGGKARYEGPRSEVDILCDVAGRVLGVDGPLDWQKLRNHDEIRSLISRLVPDLKEVATIGASRHEFHIPGRVLHEPKFRTPSGRASFHQHPLPVPPHLGERQVKVMTVRSEGQFNTVVYDNEDIYRGQERRDVILLNPLDLTAFGFVENQRVDIASESGVMRGLLIRGFDIARGCALMYYPEANVLVPRTNDPRSKTPAFKSVVVTLSPAAGPVVSREELSNPSARRGGMKAC